MPTPTRASGHTVTAVQPTLTQDRKRNDRNHNMMTMRKAREIAEEEIGEVMAEGLDAADDARRVLS